MKHQHLAIAALVLSASASFAQVTAGTSEADDSSRQNAASAQITAAESALEKGDYKTAEAALKPLAAAHPKDAHILYDLGFAEEHNGDTTAAEASYNEAIAADDSLAEPRVALGLMYARAHKLQAAHDQLSAASQITSAAPVVRARALRALAQLDASTDPAQASSELLEAIKLTGETEDDRTLSAELAEHSGDNASAEQAYLQALANDPNDVDARLGLGRALRSEGKLADAETVLKKGLDANPNDARFVAELATVYVAENKDDQALPLVESLRAKDLEAAKNPAITRLLARLYSMSGRETDAEPLYRQLIAAEPNDPNLLDALGAVLVREGKFAEAQQVLTKAVGMRPDFHDDEAWAEAETHLAFAASRNNDPRTVLQALAARATVLPHSAASLFLEATAYDALHHNSDAVKLYRAFLAADAGKDPDDEWKARHRIIALDHAK